MGSNFSKIKIGATFHTSEGEAYKKTSELTFESLSTGIEQYIDPFFDKKIGTGVSTSAPAIDTSARVVKNNEDAAPKKAKAKKSAKKTKK